MTTRAACASTGTMPRDGGPAEDTGASTGSMPGGIGAVDAQAAGTSTGTMPRGVGAVDVQAAGASTTGEVASTGITHLKRKL